MSSESSPEESYTEPPAPPAPSLPATALSGPLEPTQGEGDTGADAGSQKSKKKRKASQTGDDPEHPKTSTAKRQKKNDPEGKPAEPKEGKNKGKKVRIKDPKDVERPEEAEGQHGVDPTNTQAVDQNNNVRYGIMNEERLSTSNQDTEEHVPFTEPDVARARQRRDQQAVECFFRQSIGSAAEINRTAEMRLDYIRPYTVTNNLWAVWPELSLIMRLNLLEGLMEVENSKAAEKLKKQAAQLRNELERAQVLMRDSRRWEEDDDESEMKREKSTAGRERNTSTAKPNKKEKEKPEDDEEESDDSRVTWLPKDEERLQRLLQEGGEESEAQGKEWKETLDKSKPLWRPAEVTFSEHYTKALKERVPETSWKGEFSKGVRALSYAHKKRFARSKFNSKGDIRRGLYRPPFAVNKKLGKDPKFRKLWGLSDEKVAKSEGDGTADVRTSARRRGKKNDENQEDQQQDVDMEDDKHSDSNGNTFSDHGSDADPDEHHADIGDESDADNNAGLPSNDEDSSDDDDSSESDSDSEDHDQRRLAKGKQRAEKNAEKKKKRKEQAAEIKRIEKEIAEAKKKKAEEADKKDLENGLARVEKKKSLRNGGRVYTKKTTTEKVKVDQEKEEVMLGKDSEVEEGSEEEEDLEGTGAQEQDDEDKDEFVDR